MAYPVPGFSHLATERPQGPNLFAGQIDLRNVNVRLLSILNQVGKQLGRTVTIFSGYRTDRYSASVGGFAGDPHARGIAVDANIDGRPIGSYPDAVALIHRLGARSGATDFQYRGASDPAHVDLVGTSGGPAVTTTTARSSIDSTDTFWYALETRLGLPHNRATHTFLQGWANIEGTKARYNPLATTLRQPGSTSFNSVGVQNYPTPEIGVAATADTLRNYPAVLAVLRGKASPYGNAAFNTELNKWSGNADKGATVTPYVRSWLLQAQSNPSGKDATDWLSADPLGPAVASAADAALAVPRFLAKLMDPSYILRGLQVIAGAVLVLVGVGLLVRQVALAADVPIPTPARIPLPGTDRDIYQRDG